MSEAPEVGAAVVGGGIAGLAAALELQRQMREVLLIDGSDRPGGVMRTDHVTGYVVERGPSAFQVKAPMASVLSEHGLDERLQQARAASRLRFVVHQGRLVPLPLSPLGLVRTRLLSPAAKLRLLAEPFVSRRGPEGESALAFARRRLGAETAERLLVPFLTGVYAGDADTLGADCALAGLVELERRHGSLTVGAVATALRRRGPRGLPGTWSGLHGVGPLARDLAARLHERPILGARVTRLRREAGAWRVELSSSAGETVLRTRRVVLAAGASDAAALLREEDAEAAEAVRSIPHVPIVALPLGVPGSGLGRRVEGFGFLVPPAEGGALLGCLYMSQVFPGRAPPGHELLHCMLGGSRWPEVLDEPEDRLTARAVADLERILDLRCDPQVLGVARWPRAIPQPGPDHRRQMTGVRERVDRLGGLALAGGWLAGVSVSDAFASGLAAALRLGPSS